MTIKKLILIALFIQTSFLCGQSEIGFTLKGGANIPIGDFDNFYKTGVGGIGGLFYNINQTTRLSFLVGYNNWSLDLDALNKELNNSGNKGKYDIEAPVEAIPILLNVKFFFVKQKNIHLYAVLEGGIYKMIREIYGRYFYEDGSSFNISPSTENVTNGCFNFGLGFEYPLNEVIKFDMSAKYHIILNKDLYNFGDLGYGASYSTNNFISIYAGVNVII